MEERQIEQLINYTKECEEKQQVEYCNKCGMIKPLCKCKPMTNADRIRSMTDEELSKHFSDLIKDAQEYEYCEDVSDWLKWLQQEIK